MFSQIFFIFLLLCASFCAFHISRSDFRRRIIPDVYLFPLMLTGLILISFYNWPIDISGATIGATFGYFISAFTGFLFDSYLRKHNPDAVAPIGMGDIKLMAVTGLICGFFKVFNILFYALLFSFVCGVVLLALKKADRRERM